MKVCILTKVITSLAYATDDTDTLLDLCDKLKLLENQLRESLPSVDGLIVRSTSLSERTRRIKQKYSKIFSQAKKYASLDSAVQHKRGPKRKDWRFRNRVGSKVD